jgi:Domain of unknown function (DUF5666)
MKAFVRFFSVSLFCLSVIGIQAKARPFQDAPPAQTPAPPQQAAPPQGQGRGGERRPGVFGKLTAVNGESIEVTRQNGDKVTVKIASGTQFRKEGQDAKLTDFKVGDEVFVRGAENADHTWTADVVGARPAGFGGGQRGGGAEGGRGGGPGGGSGGGRPAGVLGQDYVVGEVKTVDAPKLTILRPDNVTQTVELSEETSLRKGREAITMADIQPGDHIMVRGGMANNAFQPKSLIIFGAEQWKRMQEMGMAGGAPANAPKDNSQPQKPPEPQH